MPRREYLDHLLTLEELAQKLRVSVRTVRSWLAKGILRPIKFQRRVYIDARIVEELLQRGAVPARRRGNSPSPRPTGQGGDEESEDDTCGGILIPS